MDILMLGLQVDLYMRDIEGKRSHTKGYKFEYYIANK